MIFRFSILIFGISIFLFSSCSDDTIMGSMMPEEIEEEEETFVIYTGSTVSFSKADESDPTDAANQDRITEDVWITRGNEGGQIFNIKKEDSSNKNASPAGTEWSLGTTDEISDLDFKPFRDAVESPKDVVGKNLVLHLIDEDEYLQVKFTSWSTGKAGGFAYERASK